MVLSFNVCWLMFSRKAKKLTEIISEKCVWILERANVTYIYHFICLKIFSLIKNIISIYISVLLEKTDALWRHTEPVFQSHSNQSIFGVNKQPELNWSLLLSYSLFPLWLWNGKNKSKCCIVYFSFHLLAIIIRLQSEKPNWIENLIWLAWVSMRIILFHTIPSLVFSPAMDSPNSWYLSILLSGGCQEGFSRTCS